MNMEIRCMKRRKLIRKIKRYISIKKGRIHCNSLSFIATVLILMAFLYVLYVIHQFHFF